MARKPKKPASQQTEAERLAALLRDALISAWIAHNPHHNNPDFEAVRHAGEVGYERFAEQLILLGVKPPEVKQ